MPRMPRWNPPKDMEKALEEGGGFWEDERWTPIRLTAMSGTGEILSPTITILLAFRFSH